MEIRVKRDILVNFYDRRFSPTRKKIGEKAFRNASSEVKRMSYDEAVNLGYKGPHVFDDGANLLVITCEDGYTEVYLDSRAEAYIKYWTEVFRY